MIFTSPNSWTTARTGLRRESVTDTRVIIEPAGGSLHALCLDAVCMRCVGRSKSGSFRSMMCMAGMFGDGRLEHVEIKMSISRAGRIIGVCLAVLGLAAFLINTMSIIRKLVAHPVGKTFPTQKPVVTTKMPEAKPIAQTPTVAETPSAQTVTPTDAPATSDAAQSTNSTPPIKSTTHDWLRNQEKVLLPEMFATAPSPAEVTVNLRRIRGQEEKLLTM